MGAGRECRGSGASRGVGIGAGRVVGEIGAGMGAGGVRGAWELAGSVGPQGPGGV